MWIFPYSIGRSLASAACLISCAMLNPIILTPLIAFSINFEGFERMAYYQYDEALPFFEKAAAFDHSNLDSHYFRAMCYWLTQRYALGLPEITKCLAVKPDDVEYLNMRADIYEGMHFSNLALEDRNHCVRLDGNNPSTLILRSFVLEDLGRCDEALADATQAARLDGCYFADRGYLLGRMGHKLEALEDFDRALKFGATKLAHSKDEQERLRLKQMCADIEQATREISTEK